MLQVGFLQNKFSCNWKAAAAAARISCVVGGVVVGGDGGDGVVLVRRLCHGIVFVLCQLSD